jgi:hypothetical protein
MRRRGQGSAGGRPRSGREVLDVAAAAMIDRLVHHAEVRTLTRRLLPHPPTPRTARQREPAPAATEPPQGSIFGDSQEAKVQGALTHRARHASSPPWGSCRYLSDGRTQPGEGPAATPSTPVGQSPPSEVHNHYYRRTYHPTNPTVDGCLRTIQTNDNSSVLTGFKSSASPRSPTLVPNQQEKSGATSRLVHSRRTGRGPPFGQHDAVPSIRSRCKPTWVLIVFSGAAACMTPGCYVLYYRPTRGHRRRGNRCRNNDLSGDTR